MKKVLSLSLVAVMLFFSLLSCGADKESTESGIKETTESANSTNDYGSKDDAEKNSTKYTKNNKEIYIGASGPLTGDAAVYGKAVYNSALMAVEEINAAGGIEINGQKVKIKFVMMDDAHDATKVAENYAKMFEAGMQIGLGCVTNRPCMEFKNLSKKDNLFFLTPSASTDTIVEFENAFQMCFADNKQGAIAAKYINENYAGKKIGVLYNADDTYSTGIFKEFKSTLNSSELVEASFDAETSSFASQIQTLKNCDLIFMPIYYGPAAQFMQEGKNIVNPKAVYYGCDGLDGIDTAVEGFDITSIPQEVSFLAYFDLTATSGATKDYIDHYVAKFGTNEPLNQFGASAYDCIYAIAAALEKADGISVTSSPSYICEALKAVFTSSDFSISGATGANISWNRDGFVQKDAVKIIVKEAN